MADKSVPRNHLSDDTLMDKVLDSRITEIAVYLYTYNSDNHIVSMGW